MDTKISPMMDQYIKMKEECKDSLLFFRLGDFYELFFEDAVTVSKELNLVLTGKSCGLPERAPMCGIPYHAIESYLAKLIQKGYKVTICEQTAGPGGKNKLMKRDVTRVVTPGTVTESSILTEDKNNYLVSVYCRDNCVGVAWADISTGEFNHTFIDGRVAVGLNDLLARIEPVEIICNQEMFAESINLSIVKYGGVCPFTAYNENAYEYDNAAKLLREQLSAENFREIKQEHSIRAAGALLSYILDTQKVPMKNMNRLVEDDLYAYMAMDANTRRTLELIEPLLGNKKQNTLLGCLNRTKTGMGARMLKKLIERPEMDVEVINKRLDFVEELLQKSVNCRRFSAILDTVYDIERLTARLSAHKILPIELISLSNSLKAVIRLKCELGEFSCSLAKEICKVLADCSAVCDLIDTAINDPNKLVDESGEKKKLADWVFNVGFDKELDECRNLMLDAKSVLTRLLEMEKNATGIKNMKLGFNNIFGYYFEISKTQTDMVPYRYTRKQTTTNAERYVTEELKDLEAKILGAEERKAIREAELYAEFIDRIFEEANTYLSTAKGVATLDCFVSYATVAGENNYVKPKVTSGDVIKISEGRHPVVEKILRNESFVPNDTFLDCGENKIMLITGPNMAGKSIYMKQVALITIMAQIGCFVPASSAEIGVVDKIFTRVGAGDDLSTGRSTFMVEMTEVTEILNNATDKSLLIMDEIGRGTSTFDGLSIAWAIIEYVSNHFAAKVLFSTHYHEMTDLEGTLPGVKNYKLTVREFNNTILFLRKLLRGSANRSFGIEVAGLTGLPSEVILRAKEILKRLEASDLHHITDKSMATQMSLFATDGKTHEICKILRELDLDEVSPRSALDILADLKEKAEQK